MNVITFMYTIAQKFKVVKILVKSLILNKSAFI